jgi:hypothetical protein
VIVDCLEGPTQVPVLKEKKNSRSVKMNISSLLNHPNDERESTVDSSDTEPRPEEASRTTPTSTPACLDTSKPSPKSVYDQSTQSVRYAPYETGIPKGLQEQHERFGISKIGKIANSIEHIPYNSQKRAFLKNTGRTSINGSFQF